MDKFQLFVLGSGYEEVLARIKATRVPILVLTEYVHSYVCETVETVDERVAYTSKYQSMDVITKKMQTMAEAAWKVGDRSMAFRELEVVGIFSPVKHEMQMLFSLLYAKNMGRDRKVLYINLLEFSGFSEIFGDTEYDLGDAILQVREPTVRVERLLESVYEGEDFSYISPFVNPENIKEVSAEDVKGLLKVIEEYTDYQTVILDIGINIRDFTEVFLACSKLYCLGKMGYLFEAQIRQFLSYLEKVVDEAFLERINRIELPGQVKVTCGGTNLLEQLDWSEFGDFVRAKL